MRTLRALAAGIVGVLAVALPGCRESKGELAARHGKILVWKKTVPNPAGDPSIDTTLTDEAGKVLLELAVDLEASPDGRWLLAQRSHRARDNALYVFDTQSAREIGRAPGGPFRSHEAPFWSPGGRYLLCAGERIKLLAISENGATVEDLYTCPATHGVHEVPGWSPDGAFVAVILVKRRTDGTEYELLRIDASGSRSVENVAVRKTPSSKVRWEAGRPHFAEE